MTHTERNSNLFPDNEAMVGLKKTEAGSDLAAVKKKKVVKAEVKAEEQYEEWNGIES